MSALIYNVTIKIEHEAKNDWLLWMKDHHIPDVMATACFRAYRICKLQGHDDKEGATFAIQYDCPSQALLDIYQKDHAPALRKDIDQKFKGKFVAFRSLLEVLDQG